MNPPSPNARDARGFGGQAWGAKPQVQRASNAREPRERSEICR